jgi:hypothetical protein
MNKLLLMTVLGLAWATVCLADETYLGKLSANPYGEGMSFTGMMTVD